MNQVDFVCDDGTTSLLLLCRNPGDLSAPAESIRLRVQCSDCVADLTVDAHSFAGFLDMFDNPPAIVEDSQQWVASAGEWRLTIDRIAKGFRFTSQIDSLLDIHRWKLETSFEMNETCFNKLQIDVRQFIGAV